MLDKILTAWCEQNGLPPPVPEFRFHPSRKWRFDFAFVEQKLAVEIEGLTVEGGRHQRVAGYSEDLLKYNEALCLGWRILRVTRRQINKGLLLVWLEKLLLGSVV